jgi:thiosulfate reductase cytochrome b subunit
MYYNYPSNPIRASGLKTVAVIHTAGAFLLVVFLIIHFYLKTTGTTVTSNLKTMITGYQDEPDKQP